MINVDVILTGSTLNGFLGGVYCIASVGFLYLLQQLKNATPAQYTLIMSKKTNLVGIYYAIAATCATVAYQNFFDDFSQMLLWWRLCLISSIAVVTWRWGIFAKKVRETINHD